MVSSPPFLSFRFWFPCMSLVRWMEGAAQRINADFIANSADYTIPIGQVSYQSNVTFHTEFMPVTINMVVKRGCDFMLFNMIEKLADEGVLTSVKTGRTAF